MEQAQVRCPRTSNDLSCKLSPTHSGEHVDSVHGRWSLARVDAVPHQLLADAPSEVELIGRMSEALALIPEEGRAAALRYVSERYGVWPRLQ